MSQKQKKFGQTKKPADIKSKKISFFAAVLLVIGSSIGAGTFLKNKEVLLNTGNSIVLLLLSWIISIIAVICMAISLIEITSGAPNDNGGFASWNKTFNKRIIYKMSKNFLAYLYMPLTFFWMPMYAIMMIQDAFGWQTNWYIAAVISFAFSMWFIILSGLSSKAGNIQNQILSYLKFVPLLFAAIIGFVCLAMGKSNVTVYPTQTAEGVIYPSWLPETWGKVEGRQFLNSMFPMLGIVASIPAILFAYDGFYSAASIQTEMQHPEKTGRALAIGLLIVSVANIVIAISLCFCSRDGKLGGIDFGLEGDANKALHIIIAIMELFVALGILGIINSMAIWTPRFYEYLIKSNELWVPEKYRAKLNDHCPKVGVVYTIIISTIFFVACVVIGSFGYFDVNAYGSTQMISIIGEKAGQGYGLNENNINMLYSFTDLMGNWTSVFAFAFIILSMVGGIFNRKTKEVKVKETKGFYPCTIISVTIISIGLIYLVIAAIANVPIVATWHSQINETVPETDPSYYAFSEWRDQMIGVSVTLVLLIAFFLICYIPGAVAIRNEKTPSRGSTIKKKNNNTTNKKIKTASKKIVKKHNILFAKNYQQHRVTC